MIFSRFGAAAALVRSTAAAGRSFSVASSLSRAAAPQVVLNQEQRRLDLVTESGRQESFPFVWLRDNCQCPKCFEPKSFSRIVNLREFSVDVRPTEARLSEDEGSGDDGDGGRVVLRWEDGHESEFPRRWLLSHSFSQANREEHARREDIEPEVWDANFGKEFPRADYDAIMSDDKYLLMYLVNLARFGFVLVEGAGEEMGRVPKLQDRIAFQKLTHYGPGYTVEVRSDPSNISHTYHRIGLHTDLTYYDYMPGGIFLHCIKQHQGEGGETILADGFKAAQLLERSNPEAHRLLSDTVVRFRDVGTDFVKFNKLNKTTFFVRDTAGQMSRINWSHFARDSRMDVPLELVDPLYRAMKAYDDLINSEECHVKHKMRPGDIVSVVNTRVMHGRTELRGKLSSRSLQCGYMDWDEIASRVRVLRKDLGEM